MIPSPVAAAAAAAAMLQVVGSMNSTRKRISGGTGFTRSQNVLWIERDTALLLQEHWTVGHASSLIPAQPSLPPGLLRHQLLLPPLGDITESHKDSARRVYLCMDERARVWSVIRWSGRRRHHITTTARGHCAGHTLSK